MSWLGALNDSVSSFSSITGQIGGQISNFTKEVLTETSEENIDYEVENKKLCEELKRKEALITDLLDKNRVLEERSHKAELQLSTSENEWRNRLEVQNKKLAQSGYQVDNQIPIRRSGDGERHSFQSSFTTVNLNREEDEFHDIIAKQREIERLSSELDGARKEISELRDKVKVAASVSGDAQRRNTDSALQLRIQELENDLRREADHHRKEMQTLEECNNAAMLRHQQEVKKLKRDNSGNDGDSLNSEKDYVLSMRKDMQSLESELEDSKNQMRIRNRQLLAQKKQIEEMKADAEKNKLQIDQMEAVEQKLKKNQEEFEEEKRKLRSEIERAKQKLTIVTKGIAELTSDDCLSVNSDESIIEARVSDCVQRYRQLQDSRSEIQAENEEYRKQIDALNKSLSKKADKDSKSEEVLASQRHGTIQWPKDENSTDVDEHSGHSRAPKVFPSHLDFGTPIGHSSPQVHQVRRALLADADESASREPGDLTLTRQALQKQIEDYEQEIAAFERVQREWYEEKTSLESMLARYQSEVEGSPRDNDKEPKDERAATVEKLQHEISELQKVRSDLERDFNRVKIEKDQFQVAAKSLESQFNTSMGEAKLEKDLLQRELDGFSKEKERLQEAYDVLTRELNESRMEKDALDEALGALDSQHQDEMRELLVVRDALKEQLKEAMTQLDMEKSARGELEQKYEISVQDSETKLQQYDASLSEKNQEIAEMKKEYEVLSTKVKDLELSSRNEAVSRELIKSESGCQTEQSTPFEIQGNLQTSVSISNENDMDELKASVVKELQDELNDKDDALANLTKEKTATEARLREEISRLQAEIENLGLELEDSGKETCRIQREHEEMLAKLRSESRDELEKTTNDLRLQFQQERDDIAKETDATCKVYQQKTAHLERELENARRELAETLQGKETMIENLTSRHSDLDEEYRSLVKNHESLKTTMCNNKTEADDALKTEIEKKNELQRECLDLKATVDKMTAFEVTLKNEIETLNSAADNYKIKISELEVTRQAFSQRESELIAKISSLTAETERLKSELADVSNSASPPLPAVSEELLGRLGSDDVTGAEKSDLSKDDVGSLLKLIEERESTIEALKRASASRPQTAPSPGHEQLKSDFRALSSEKDQILSVISEKTKENRKLKDEMHKMVGVVAESKAALEKVQTEHSALLKKYEGHDDEMTKEGISKLSRLVMEKDLEIESLKQKCGGGVSENMVSGEQVQALLQDKEILSSQVRQLLNERNHLVSLLNQSQVEVNAARAEASKAAEALEKDADNNSKLQIGYSNLVHDYDQVQLKMTSLLRELGALQEKLGDLERIKTYLLGKLEQSGIADFQQVQESLQTNANDSAENASSKSSDLESSNAETHRRDIALLRNDLKEKDLLIHSKTEQLTRISKDFSAKSNEATILRRSVENLREQVSTLSKNCDDTRREMREVSNKLEEKESESGAFQETNAQLSMMLKEREYELEGLREKCQRLDTLLEEVQQGTRSESQRYLDELDSSKQALIHARHEKDQVMLSLKQKKMEADKSAEEARNARAKEGKLQSELERLRNHLVQVEETYTQEAVIAEDLTATLREQLEKAQSHQNAVRQAGEHYQQQVEGLQEQLRAALAQRDHAIHQLQLAQEQSVQYATTVQNIQVAVERTRREDAASFAENISKINGQLETATIDASTYRAMAEDLQAKLNEATDALKSASRLNVQLETKEENINHLKGLVAEKQLENDDLQNKIHLLTSKSEGMVDKDILKNLLLGYFTTPHNQRQEVLRLISGVLNFSDDELKRIVSPGGEKGARAWIGGWLWKGDGRANKQPASLPSTPRSGNPNQSFTQMFVKFLETESVPHQAPRLPMAAMINEAQRKRRTTTHSVPTPISNARNEPTVAGRYSPYLLSSTPNGRDAVASNPVAITPVLPSFEPIINPKPAGEQDILQDILLNRGDG